MNTPWGASQQVETITRGVHWVSTAGHGGLMVSAGLASKVLSERAVKNAFPGMAFGYVCFEEDCAYSVAFYERPEWKRHLDQHQLNEWQCSNLAPDSFLGKAKARCVPELAAELQKSDDEIRADMLAIVAKWVPEYLEASSCDSPASN